MVFGGKKQKQKAGPNSTQQQIETQNVVNISQVTVNVVQQSEDASEATTLDKQAVEKTIEEYNIPLWERTLGKDDVNVKPLRESYLQARENAEFLLSKINQDFPSLTLHDITHVVSLWNIADTIIGNSIKINPLEGYILGIAFLIHDAALSYYAVGGKVELRETIEWEDEYAEKPDNVDEEEFKKECDFAVICANHAREAEEILFKQFLKEDGSTFYIVNDEKYRKHYGELIGMIAASHCWSIDEVELKLNKQIGLMSGMPKKWNSNAAKLACILRCADIGHIDDGRAPDDNNGSVRLDGNSESHWVFQNHLCQVCEDEKDSTKLCVLSSNPFKKEDFVAWHMAYDAVKLFDEELKKSNHLLKGIRCEAFPYDGISGADSKEELAKYIETKDWEPCNIGVHVSNIETLIKNLGGSKLYGSDNLLMVALRELIQNARDAIHARRKLDDGFDEGRITIRLKKNDGRHWIEVEDNGIGMSMNCIKYHLLDFGSSYWKSSLAKKENPGLRSKGFKSVGKFGIGFYSVFMVAKSVEVVTKRYDKSAKDANKIEFPEGLTLSHVLSVPTNLKPSLSTIVRFELKDEVDIAFKVQGALYSHSIPLSQMLSVLTAGLDADVYFENQGLKQRVHPNVKSLNFDKKEWLGCLFIDKPENIGELASQLEKITDERGDIRGWVLSPEWIDKIAYPKPTTKDFASELIPSFATIGGLVASLDMNDSYSNNGYIGYVDGVEDSISRNKMVFDEPLKNCLQSWAKEKYYNKYSDFFNNNNLAKLYCSFIQFCGIKDDIVSDNMKRLYSTKLSEIVVGTMNGLRKIHLFMFAGVYEHVREIEATPESVAEKLFVLLDKPNERDRESKLSEILDPLIRDRDERIEIRRLYSSLKQISKMPTSNYKEIMYKYYELIKCNPFYYGNIRTIGVWVNLLLNQQCNKMIDWRNVDVKHLMDLIRDEKYNETSCYLEQFLSSTYLTEMKVPLT